MLSMSGQLSRQLTMNNQLHITVWYQMKPIYLPFFRLKFPPSNPSNKQQLFLNNILCLLVSNNIYNYIYHLNSSMLFIYYYCISNNWYFNLTVSCRRRWWWWWWWSSSYLYPLFVTVMMVMVVMYPFDFDKLIKEDHLSLWHRKSFLLDYDLINYIFTEIDNEKDHSIFVAYFLFIVVFILTIFSWNIFSFLLLLLLNSIYNWSRLTH